MHDVAELWQEAWKQLLPHHVGRDAWFHAETHGLDLRCLVDPFPIEQVFRNIFENSLAACHDPVRIGIDCADAELNGQSALQVRIRDNGAGLTSEQRERIFEPFFTTKTNGTGLGMAIAKRIVEAHEGKISVCADTSVGTAIEVLLLRGGT
jgi:signal transduction histidine kinase